LHDLCSKKRSRELSFSRQVAMFLMKKTTNNSLRDIGKFLGGRDHSTVIYAVDKIKRYAQTNNQFQVKLRIMEEELL